MAHPFTSTYTARRTSTAGVSMSAPQADWRCTRCDKLLGVLRDGQMHIRFARGHEYFAAFPVTATCRDCGTLNQASGSAA